MRLNRRNLFNEIQFHLQQQDVAESHWYGSYALIATQHQP